MPEPVVVGVDGTVNALRAVRWATEHAGRHGTGLRLVHAVERPYGEDRAACLLRASCTSDERPEEAAEVVAECLAPWQLRYSEVKVSHEIVLDRPGEALLDRAAGARLVVVGSRRRTGPARHEPAPAPPRTMPGRCRAVGSHL